MKNKTKILSVIAGALFVLGAYVFTNNSTTNILGAISVTIPSAPGTGYIPFSSSTGAYSPYLLVAGSGVSIATTSGQITISASGSSFTTTTINGLSSTAYTFNIAGTNGLSYSTSTGTITLTQATSTGSQSGFLSSTDWTTFNSKQSTISFPLPYASTTPPTILGGTGISVSTSNGTSTITNIGVTSLIAGTDTTVSNSTGTVTVGNAYASSTYSWRTNNLSDLSSTSTARTNLGVDVTKSTNEKTLPWSGSFTTSTSQFADNFLGTMWTTSTIDRVDVTSRDSSNTLTWNLLYGTDPTAATSTWSRVFSADQVTTSTVGGLRQLTSFSSSTPGRGQFLVLYIYNASTTYTNWTVHFHEQ